MNAVIHAVNSTITPLRGGNKLWAGFSKSKAERDRGGVDALARRVVRYLSPDAEERLETEYASGTAWLGDTKICSSLRTTQADLFQGFDSMEGAWVHIGELAKELKVSKGEVAKTIQKLKRGEYEEAEDSWQRVSHVSWNFGGVAWEQIGKARGTRVFCPRQVRCAVVSETAEGGGRLGISSNWALALSFL